MADRAHSDPVVPYTDKDASVSHADENLQKNEVSGESQQDGSPLPPAKSKRGWLPGALIAILSLIAVTAVVASQFLLRPSAETRYGRSSSSRPSRHGPSHVEPNRLKAQVKDQEPVAFRLDFPALFPDIASQSDSECRAAWHTLCSVPCHDKIFTWRADDSRGAPFDPEMLYTVPKVCDPGCKAALEEAYTELSAKCSATDTFVTDNYDGMLDKLDLGPVATIKTLLRRIGHLCRSAPDGESDYEYCTVEMWERFRVNDGLSPNLWAISSLTRETDSSSVIAAHRQQGERDVPEGRYSYDYWVREQKHGPGDGETTCGWCVFDMLNRTLNSWDENHSLSPDSHDPVSLPEFIRRVRTVGRRCAPTSEWDAIYYEAIASYQAAGLLPADWEHSLPSGDLHYLMKNGPSDGDSPVSDVLAEVQRVSSLEFLKEAEKIEGSYDEIMNTFNCLSSLAKVYTSASCYINLPRDMLPTLLQPTSSDLRSAYCSHDCSEAFRNWRESGCDPERATPEGRELFSQYWADKDQRDTFCSLLRPHYQSSSCAQAVLNLDKVDWVLSGRPNTQPFITEIDAALEELKEEAEERSAITQRDGSQKVLGSTTKNLDSRSWMRALRTSVCAGCIWNWLAGTDLEETMGYIRDAPSPSEYVEFVKKYHSTCTSLGANWLGGVPYGEDPVIWRVEDEHARVMRYIEAPGIMLGRRGTIVTAVNEVTGWLYSVDEDMRPGKEVGSLWHLLQAERGLKAEEEGRFAEWMREEKQHRQEADSEIWEVTWSGVRYIGDRKKS